MIISNPVHPQANGKVESNNKIIVNNLNKRLDKKKGRWAEKLPFVLWADRTTSKMAIDQTRYSLVSETEVVTPTEVVIPTARYLLQDQENNDSILAKDLDTFRSSGILPNYALVLINKESPRLTIGIQRSEGFK